MPIEALVSPLPSGADHPAGDKNMLGHVEMAIAGPSFLATWYEPIGAFDAAYAFHDYDHLMAVAEGEIGAALWEGLREQHGIRVLGTWFYGVRHITANRPIRRPEDLRGFRLRMPDARVWQATGAALGATPMPVAFAEVYLALQQGLVDGQENPIPTIQAVGFHEVQSHLSLTGHIQSSTQVLIAESLWQRLSESLAVEDDDAVADGAADELLHVARVAPFPSRLAGPLDEDLDGAGRERGAGCPPG
jgi:TRAP-type transport system periplasmic protein